MTTHDTIVIGATKDMKIIFFKSFSYRLEKDDAQKAIKHAQTYPVWQVSNIDEGTWRLHHLKVENDDYEFKIPTP